MDPGPYKSIFKYLYPFRGLCDSSQIVTTWRHQVQQVPRTNPVMLIRIHTIKERKTVSIDWKNSPSSLIYNFHWFKKVVKNTSTVLSKVFQNWSCNRVKWLRSGSGSKFGKISGSGSKYNVSGSVLLIRARIGSVFCIQEICGSGSVFRIRIHSGKY